MFTQTTAGVDTWEFSTTETGATKSTEGTMFSVHLTVQGTGAVNAVAEFQMSNTPEVADSWVTVATLTASGTNSGVDYAVFSNSFAYNRAVITTLTGTGAVAGVSASAR